MNVEDAGVVVMEQAARALRERFGPLLDDEYVPGKTRMRDALCERFDLSQLEAEELCDELERAKMIHYVETEEGSAFHIHADVSTAA